MGKASGYLACLHTVILLIGLAYVGIAAYLLIEGINFLPSSLEQYNWAAYVPLAFGIVIVLIAFLGLCCETISKNRCFIAIYAVLQLVFAAVIVAAGVGLVIFSGQYVPIIAASTNVVADVPPGPENIQLVLANILLGLQAGCCGNIVPSCEDDAATPVTEGDRTFCYDPAYETQYETAVASAVTGDDTYCQIPDLIAACNSTTPVSAWLDANEELMATYLWPAGIALTVFGVLLILAFCASCSLLCRSSDEDDSQPKQQRAGDTAGTGGARSNSNNINYS